MTAPNPAPAADASTGSGRLPLMAVAWLWVGAPFAYGVYELGLKLKQLFTG
ncbi:MFS transporter small subunit [Actinacidiphila sp. bgisy160]|uniref:MFS transporter small subunit n=1 Tax=Actinacidiphila sp. bgisy160 TaxID=3413796 RepID=UPI003D75FBF5